MNNLHSFYHTEAEVYDRLLVPQRFAAPAKNLIESMNLKRGDHILDVGTGTGVILPHARRAVGSKGSVIGL